eukprot:PhF_6_TR37220/c2_g4_i5/m.54900
MPLPSFVTTFRLLFVVILFFTFIVDVIGISNSLLQCVNGDNCLVDAVHNSVLVAPPSCVRHSCTTRLATSSRGLVKFGLCRTFLWIRVPAFRSVSTHMCSLLFTVPLDGVLASFTRHWMINCSTPDSSNRDVRIKEK